MAGASTYLADLLINFWLRSGTWPTKPTNIYVSLHAGAVGEAGANEVSTSGTGYARVAVSVADGSWTAPADATGGKRRVTNLVIVTFPNPTANWGTITDVGFWSAATAGNFIEGDALGLSRIVNAGDVAPSFAVGTLGFAVA